MNHYFGKVFPNGIQKSRLFEIFLCFRDFDCCLEDYEFDLEIFRIQEGKGEEICQWYKDVDGKFIVANLQLRDSSKRLAIMPNSFELIPVMHKIFISYAREDYLSARRLFDELKAAGFNPWLDKEHLLPGHRWEVEIEKAIRDSNFFVALLSSRSVAKRGFVQREIRRALDVLDQIPEADIYLIPTRLDECTLAHNALRNIQWVDLFPDWETGFEMILKALRAGR